MDSDNAAQPRRNRRTRRASNTRQRQQNQTVSRPQSLAASMQNIGQSILPARKTVVVSTQWTGYLAPGTQQTGANFASINPNSLVTPFLPLSGNTFVASASAYSFRGTTTGGSNVGGNPIGYTFLNTYWETYKVTDYEVEFTVNPQLSGDACAIAMAPLGDQEQPANGSNWSYYTMCAQRYAVSGRATNGANTRLNTLRYRGPVHRDLGLTRRQWMDYPQTDMGAQPSGNNTISYFGIFLSAIDGSTNVSPIVVDVVLRQRVIVSDPVNMGN